MNKIINTFFEDCSWRNTISKEFYNKNASVGFLERKKREFSEDCLIRWLFISELLRVNRNEPIKINFVVKQFHLCAIIILRLNFKNIKFEILDILDFHC